jgi:hypothetical protein
MEGLVNGGSGDPFAEMRSPVTPLVGAAEAAVQRGRVVARMQQLQDSARQERNGARVIRRRLRGGFAALAVSAAIACAWAYQRGRADAPVAVVAPFIDARSGETAVLRGNQSVTAGANEPLPLRSSDQVRTRGGGATLKLRSGATVELKAATELRLVQDERALEEVLLKEGYVDVRVPKLAKGELLVVRTPDSSVTVRGTRFTVSFDRGCRTGQCTNVNVTEGRVEVEHAGAVAMLGSGDSWTSEDTTPADSAISRGATVAPGAAANASSSTSPGPPQRRLPPKAATLVARERSTLAEETALLEHAMTASRAGNSERAVTLLDEHLEKYPGSQLARNAELERLRALERTGNLATARAAARRYLARYPDGMGSDEARRIALAARARGSRPLSDP